MEGYIDSQGNEKKPYKFTGAIASQIKAALENCYEYSEAQGFSSITEETKNSLSEAIEAQIYTKSFYQDTLHFDGNIWDLDVIEKNGYPELKSINKTS